MKLTGAEFDPSKSTNSGKSSFADIYRKQVSDFHYYRNDASRNYGLGPYYGGFVKKLRLIEKNDRIKERYKNYILKVANGIVDDVVSFESVIHKDSYMQYISPT